MTNTPITSSALCTDCLAEAEEVPASYLVDGDPVCDCHLDIRAEG